MSNRHRYSDGAASGDGPHEPFGDLPQVDDRICDYVDGCLSPRELDRFEAELRVSDRLRAQLEAYRETVADVREALNAPIVQVDLADRVMAAIASGAQPVPDSGAPSTTGSGRVLPFVMALVSAAALLAIAIWLDAFGTRTAPDLADDVAAESSSGEEAKNGANDERGFARGGQPRPFTVPDLRSRSETAPPPGAPVAGTADEPQRESAWNPGVAPGSKDDNLRDRANRELGKQAEAGNEGGATAGGENLRQLPAGASNNPEQAKEEAEADAGAPRKMVVAGADVDESAGQRGGRARRADQAAEPSAERQADAPGVPRSQLPSEAQASEVQGSGGESREFQPNEPEQAPGEVGIGGGAGARNSPRPRAPAGPTVGRGPAGRGGAGPGGTGPGATDPGAAGPGAGRPVGPSTGGPAGPSTGRPVGPTTGGTGAAPRASPESVPSPESEQLQGVGQAMPETFDAIGESVPDGAEAQRKRRSGADRQARARGRSEPQPMFRYRLFSGDAVEPDADADAADGAVARGERLTQLVFDGVVAPVEERVAFGMPLPGDSRQPEQPGQPEQSGQPEQAGQPQGGRQADGVPSVDKHFEKSVGNEEAADDAKAAQLSLLVRRFFVDQMSIGTAPGQPSEQARGSGGGGGLRAVPAPVRIGAVQLQVVGPREVAVGDLLDAERRERHWLVEGPQDEVAAVIRELTSYAEATRRRVSTGNAVVVPGGAGADTDADAGWATGSDDFFLGSSRPKPGGKAGLEPEAAPTRRLLLRFRPRSR